MTNQKVIHMCLTINIQLNWMRFFMISRIIKGKISVISLTWRLRLITLKRPWLFWISQKPQINNCFTIHVHNNPLHLKNLFSHLLTMHHAPRILGPLETWPFPCGLITNIIMIVNYFHLVTTMGMTNIYVIEAAYISTQQFGNNTAIWKGTLNPSR